MVANLRHGVAIGAHGGSEFDASRRTLFRYAAYLAGSLPFVAATYGFAAGRLRYTVERVDVPIANLPPELDGLRIAQLSDIHIGDYMPPREIARAVAMANELQPDISFVTGDFVSGEGDPLDACIGELAKLRAPLGVWGCNGNHEIYAGVEDDAERLFQQHGMRLLRARNEVIEHKGARFNLLGVDYQRDHMVSGERTGPMLSEIEHLVRRDMPNVLLSHNPNSFSRAAELGIELSLAGHTHGGQVKVEIVNHDIYAGAVDFAVCGGAVSVGNAAFSYQPSAISKSSRRRRYKWNLRSCPLCESRARNFRFSGAHWRAAGDRTSYLAQSLNGQGSLPLKSLETWYNSCVDLSTSAPLNAII